MTNLSVRESVIYSREGRRAGIRDSRASAFGQMDRKICLGLYKAGRNGMFAACVCVGSKRNVCFIVFLLFFFVGKKVSTRRKRCVFGMFYLRFLLVFGSGRSHRCFNLRRTFFHLAVNEKSLSAEKTAYMQFIAAYMRFGCIFIQSRRSFQVYKVGF